ncbi:hypothetical protein GCM10015535_33060 [Streptomyces gelaticus]|uniref:Uncharacterized protein n=1 Tax=Streptomyces gelaticus TaxID=285446 RepID=A0ABQ2VZR9_9ACTN|nr:hypothetical protein GCM10015535_33060 [Streptomyces gelaticus]
MWAKVGILFLAGRTKEALDLVRRDEAGCASNAERCDTVRVVRPRTRRWERGAVGGDPGVAERFQECVAVLRFIPKCQAGQECHTPMSRNTIGRCRRQRGEEYLRRTVS